MARAGRMDRRIPQALLDGPAEGIHRRHGLAGAREVPPPGPRGEGRGGLLVSPHRRDRQARRHESGHPGAEGRDLIEARVTGSGLDGCESFQKTRYSHDYADMSPYDIVLQYIHILLVAGFTTSLEVPLFCRIPVEGVVYYSHRPWVIST